MEGNITTQATISGGLSAEENMTGELAPVGSINGNITLPPYIPTGSSDYNDLENKPSIGGVTLEGNKTLEELGAFDGDYNNLTNKPDLFSGDYDDLTDKPSINGNALEGDMTAEELGIHIPENVSELDNDLHFITHDEIFTDLGTIDSSLYEDDVYVYVNTLTESGWYKFCWGNGDDFTYFVQVQSVDFDGNTYVNQHLWGAEEGASTEYTRGLRIEDGEVVNEQTASYLTLSVANTAFSRVGHSHVRYVAQSQSVWDYCNTVAIQNNNPLVVYFDVSTSKTYLIETYMGGHQPVYKMLRVIEMNDTSYFCQRSSYYYSGREHWGSWYKFSGTIFTP